MVMEKTNVKIIEGPVRVEGALYAGRAFGINTGAINAVICANTDEELIWLWDQIFPGDKLDMTEIKKVVIGQPEKMTKISEAI
jgi:hypothetical protein